MKMTLKLVPPKSRDRNFPFSFPLGSSRTKVGKHFTEESSWPSLVSPILMASLIFCSRTWIWSLFNIRSRMKSSINLNTRAVSVCLFFWKQERRGETNLLLRVSRLGLYVSSTSLIRPWGSSSLLFLSLSCRPDLTYQRLLASTNNYVNLTLV